MALRIGVHMGIILKFSVALPCVKSHVSRTAGAILRGDVSGKRFNTHAMERNVVRLGEGGCRNDKGMASASGE